MNTFDRLHPALQHHIVNSLGWRELRPFQEAVIPEILAGKHMIVLAPTAGGKTEAAFFPVSSKMLTEGWNGLSVLYICPIKALLNNLDIRLQRYCELLGRRSALWHGDVKPSVKKKILREPPDCLLTTPESLEVMLVSPNVDANSLFRNVQVVVIDEIHAFAGDDRGWHLLSVLERISRITGREIQRLGLSATVGNPETLVDWLAGSCEGTRDVFLPLESSNDLADVKLDFVGSLQNAAVVISRLHRGEKRLVFVDSRARAEQLSSELRRLETTTFVTHSSLSQEQRAQAEHAFATREDCVIVATSVLELGIDVGDLDRVIQIDSPPTVSSFLQRMGRTGRRSGGIRNCLFLATKDEALIHAAGLIELWSNGFVEPIEPPPVPYHVVAQQLMALVLQESGIEQSKWFGWVEGVPEFSTLPSNEIDNLVAHMLEREILWEDGGILAMGTEAEDTYGRRNFMQLLSVFMSAPLFVVLQGRQEIGYVDEMTFLGKQEDGPKILLLGGRAWKVNHIDWQRRKAYVEPTDGRGRTRWMGAGQGLGFELCQSIKTILAHDSTSEMWSQRAMERLEEMRCEYAWLREGSTVVIQTGGAEVEWWTFGGLRCNATLARALSDELRQPVKHTNFVIRCGGGAKLNDVQRAIESILNREVAEMYPAVNEDAIRGLKFSECLPKRLATQMLEKRLQDIPATTKILQADIRYVVQS